METPRLVVTIIAIPTNGKGRLRTGDGFGAIKAVPGRESILEGYNEAEGTTEVQRGDIMPGLCAPYPKQGSCPQQGSPANALRIWLLACCNVQLHKTDSVKKSRKHASTLLKAKFVNLRSVKTFLCHVCGRIQA